MGVSITIYRTAIGLFNNLKNLKNEYKTCILSEIIGYMFDIVVLMHSDLQYVSLSLLAVNAV
jgi:hypothetical protein